MAKRRRKSKSISEKNQDAKSRRFIYTLVGVVALFIIGFIVLRMSM
jgi:hypothetical protein